MGKYVWLLLVVTLYSGEVFAQEAANEGASEQMGETEKAHWDRVTEQKQKTEQVRLAVTQAALDSERAAYLGAGSTLVAIGSFLALSVPLATTRGLVNGTGLSLEGNAALGVALMAVVDGVFILSMIPDEMEPGAYLTVVPDDDAKGAWVSFSSGWYLWCLGQDHL